MDKHQLIQAAISKIATGPDLSKDLGLAESETIMRLILRSEISDVQAAIFLIAMRMKRETIEENQGVLSAIIEASDSQKANIEDLIDIGDPYSGYTRSLPISSFLPPLLAELGLPSVIHGLKSIAPKYGLTHHHIHQAMGLNPNVSTKDATIKLENTTIGWSYIDQKNYCAKLHHLIPLRNEIVKRSMINTVETLVRPIRAKKTHSILGYVHKPYPPIYANLANFSGFDTALLIRGVEGGIVPSLRQQGLMISYHKEVEKSRIDIQPKDLSIKQTVRSIPIIKSSIMDQAKYTVQLGTEALSGKQGVFYDGLVLSASLILWHTGKAESLVIAANIVRSTLDSGKSIQRIK